MFFHALVWIVLAFVMVKFSIAYALVMFNNMGQYNIGGMPNSKKKKFWTIIGFLGVLFLWYKVCQYAPFSIIPDY